MINKVNLYNYDSCRFYFVDLGESRMLTIP